MTIMISLLLVLIAFVLAAIGVLASADPQGRGGKVAVLMFGGALAVLVLAVGLAMTF